MVDDFAEGPGLMPEPAYVRIAGEYARRIRGGQLPPGTQLPSYAELARQNRVSDIVVRKAIELLQSQGLVRSARRRGIFVTDRPNLVRVSPERQLEGGPEMTYRHESSLEVSVEREHNQVPAPADIAEILGIEVGEQVTHVITRASEGDRPVSISDTYQPIGVSGISAADVLEETVADRLPAPLHAEWLRTTPGDLVKTVHQRYFAGDGRVIMVSDVSYPRERYDAFIFRMALPGAD